MRIYKSILRVPGGLMVVPLFIGMVINTFFPNLLKKMLSCLITITLNWQQACARE